MARLISGVLVLDKPRGPTSHDLVARARRALRTREIGHAGTLDPMATGVLVLAIGEATKLVPWLTASDKTYEATLTLGVGTDTFDADGRETSRAPVDLAGLDAALAIERARASQIPPAFSAVRVDGVRAHALARAGAEVELAPRPVVVRSLEATVVGGALELTLTVSKGYYVRALARDLSIALGTVGHLTKLRRVRSGAFSLADASPLEAPRIIALAAAAARALPSAILSEIGAEHARHGRPVPATEITPADEGAHAWLDARGALVAIGELREGSGRVVRGFAPSHS